ncbi:MAG: dTDP-4-dehydrorhamnose reductase [Muribaculaceae bacterium]|nr:dTDP-4-dehydrorhamnose reductase [Muribaculaceae bacterium]
MTSAILVTGCNGQLGSELRRILGDRAVYTDIDTLDLCNRDEVERFMRIGGFDYVINCAAYTAVDRAEEEKIQCHAANVEAVENLARAAAKYGSRIVQISTDYVFDGNHYTPYHEGDKTNPLSVYGITKRKGETALLGLAPESIVIRTGWLYSSFGNNFMKKMIALAQKGGNLKVVSDQIGTPTYAADLANAIVDIINQTKWTPGVYHFSNEGVASWYDFALAIIEEKAIDCAVTPISTDDYPTAATRPKYSVLDKNKIKTTYGISISHWRVALRRCLKELS